MDWAVSYADMAPYYDRVERFIGVSAAREGFPQFPDGVFLPAMPLNCAETIFTAACKSLGWPSTHRRLAQLTQPHNGRPACHYCGNCVNGCDVGAMFNPIAVTLPPALATGRLDILTDSVVARVRMNREHRAQGVTYIERHTMKAVDVDATWVILAASTLENTRLLLLSAAGGLANSSGTLGQYMMDQVGGGGVSGFLPEVDRRTQPARRREAGGDHDPQLSEHRSEDRAQGVHPWLRHERDRRSDRVSAVRGESAGLRIRVEERGEEPLCRAGSHLECRRRDAGAQGQLRRARSGGQGSLGHSSAEDPLHAQRQRLQVDRGLPAARRGALSKGRRGSAAGAGDTRGVSGRVRLTRCAAAARRCRTEHRRAQPRRDPRAARSAARFTRSAPRA